MIKRRGASARLLLLATAAAAAVALLLAAPAAGFQLYHTQQRPRSAWLPRGQQQQEQRGGARGRPLFSQTVDEAGAAAAGEKPMVRVRFVNTPEGKDIVAVAQEGDNLMKVGDKAGLSLPRACCTGLCGTCTSDLMDPSFTFKGENRPAGMREGYQTIRACSTTVKLPLGCEEMVVDVYRMKRKKGAKGSGGTTNPMERFSGDWETDFRKGSKWSALSTGNSGMALRQAKPDDGLICTSCKGTGKVNCFNCKGKGQLTMGQRSTPCYICKGEGQWYCADCQATGMISRKKV